METVENQIMTAICGSQDHPLMVGGIKIPCYVLDDETRVITENGLISALGIKYGGAGYTRAEGYPYLTGFVTGKALQPFMEKVNPALVDSIKNPILFQTSENGNIFKGYEATLLADICEAVLAARQEKALTLNQQKVAARCEILVRGFARVGIIALIDEVTGFQELRGQFALQKVLERFIDSVLNDWVKTFHQQFYVELYRLRGIAFDPKSHHRPMFVGHITNDLIYSRIVPGLKEELKRRASYDEKGRMKHRLHQMLTRDLGYPELEKHIHSVTIMMKASTEWDDFYYRLDRALPKHNTTLLLPFPIPPSAN